MAVLAFSVLSVFVEVGASKDNVLIDTTTSPSCIIDLKIGESVNL
jgi:hypothetical protein